MYHVTKRKQKGIMLSFVMIILTIPGSLSCKSSSTSAQQNSAPVTTTSPPPLYNCSFSNQSNPEGFLEVFVKNITNTTNVYCQVYLQFPENTTATDYSAAQEIWLCNKLGESFCAICNNDTGTMIRKEYDGNVTASCKQEETTTTEMPSTTMISTAESTTNFGPSYGLNPTYKGNGATTTVPDGATTIFSNGSLVTLQIALIVCAAVIVAILICASLIIHKRRKASKSLDDGKSQHQIEEENIRLEIDIGGLYTAVEKKQHGSQVVENVLYGSTTPENGDITEELYTEVDKKQKTESGKTFQLRAGSTANQELYTQVVKKRS